MTCAAVCTQLAERVTSREPRIYRAVLMTGFHVAWVLALALVAYADAVGGGCRDGMRLLGPIEDERSDSDGRERPGFDAWLDALRRWRQRSGGRSAVGGVDRLRPVSRHSQYR